MLCEGSRRGRRRGGEKGAGEEERRRDEGTRNRAKEVARRGTGRKRSLGLLVVRQQELG
jgi:hypothetical protein